VLIPSPGQSAGVRSTFDVSKRPTTTKTDRFEKVGASTLSLRLRPTVWPPQPVPVPRVLKPDRVDRDGAWLLFDTSASSLAEVPPEVYLREFRDTDPRDLDGLAELCSLGIIREVSLAEPARDLPVPEGAWQYAMDRMSTAYDLPSCTDIAGERRGRHQEDPQHRFPIHAAEVAYRVDRVKNCADHVLAYLTGQPVHEVWHNCDDDRDAWFRFTEIINPALRDFHVAVTVPSETSEAYDIGRINTTLYAVAMLQLVNDLNQDVDYHTCANETCRRPFTRQRGRTKYGGQRMHGVMYCSNTCARAQYQREKRRRDKAAQKGAERG
jgi:hypothetical protein